MNLYAKTSLELTDATIDNNWKTELLHCCEHYNGDDLIEILRLFFRKGANVNKVTVKNGFNVLMMLCMQYNQQLQMITII